MKREEMMKLYAREVEIDPKDGKERAVLKYIGPYYRMDGGAMTALRRLGWLCWGTALLALAVAGLIPTRAGNALYVQVWYLFSLLPFFYLLLGLLRMRRLKETFTAVDLSEGINYAKGAAWGLTILGGLWAASVLIYLMLNTLPERWGYDVVFLLCGALQAVMALALARAMSTARIEEIAKAA